MLSEDLLFFITSYCKIILHCVDKPHFVIHLLVDGHLDYFYSLAIMNNAAMNIPVQVFI